MHRVQLKIFKKLILLLYANQNSNLQTLQGVLDVFCRGTRRWTTFNDSVQSLIIGHLDE